MAHFYMDGVQLPQDWSHFEKAVYFLPLSSQKFQEHLIKVFPFFLHPLCPMWVQSGSFICSIIVLNLDISFNSCARLCFNVIWFVKCMKIRKLKIEIISIQHNSFIDTIHCRVSPLSYTRSTKTICLKLSTYSFI